MSQAVAIDLTVIFVAILALVSISKRIGVAYPIMLVLGGIVIGYIPGVPALAMAPDLVLVIFLPPLLYWESVTAPSSEFFASSGLLWIFQLAFGLVIATTLAVGAVARGIIPGIEWGPALVLGAIVSSTDEVAFGPIVERIRIPRHVLATIEGESLVNDATSLVLYAIGITAIVSGTFSFGHALVQVVVSIAGACVIGIVAAMLVVTGWRLTKDDSLQVLISIMAPFLAYLPARYFGVSAVLAVVVTGLTVNRFTPAVLTARARERAGGFWLTIVFMLNAFIFVLVGMQFHSILDGLRSYAPLQLIGYAAAVSATVVIVRLLWVGLQSLVPATNEPEHEDGKADWSHVAILAWSGMRGGISLAAALAIPLEAAARPFPDRNLIIFITFCVLLVTLVGQGGTLPWMMRWLNVEDDGVDEREERAALAHTARAALRKLEELRKDGDAPPAFLDALRTRFRVRWSHYSPQARRLLSDVIGAQRTALLDLRREHKVDNTVARRIQRLLDLEEEEADILGSAGHGDIDLDP